MKVLSKNSMKKHNKQRNILILALAILCLALAAYAGIFMTISSKQKETLVLYGDLALELQKEDHAKELSVFLEDVRTKQKILSGFFITKETAVSVIEEFESFAGTAGVALEILQVNVAAVSDTEEALLIDISAEGAWDNIIHLLCLFESLPIQGSISRITLDSSEEAWTLSATIQIGLQK